MITPESKKILQELGSTQYGNALQLYLDEEYRKIDSVKGITTLEETIGRQLAIKILDEIFKFMKPHELGGTSKNNYK